MKIIIMAIKDDNSDRQLHHVCPYFVFKVPNRFLQNPSDIDVLVKYTSPVSAVNQLQTSRKSGAARQAPPHLLHPAIPVFDELYR